MSIHFGQISSQKRTVWKTNKYWFISKYIHVSLIQGVPFGWTAGLLLLKDHQMTKLAGFPIFHSVKCLDCLLILVLYSLAFLWNHISKQLYSQSHVKYPETEEQLYFRLGTPFSPLLECTFSQKKFNYASNFTRHVPGCLTSSAVPANIKAV